MRLALLTALTMTAFAANSVLNRLALETGDAGPASFAAIRVVSGALMLAVLVARRDKSRLGFSRNFGFTGPLMLALYMLGFSFAYVTLQAGIGALILFGGVQVTMFAGAVWTNEAIPRRRWLGAGISFAGLLYLMWPAGAGAPNWLGAVLMSAAAFGWGMYSLIGRKAKDPLKATSSNFLLASPLGVIVWLILPDSTTLASAILAAVSGMVTSALGYALWYSILPLLGATRAAVAQLTVPVIALAGGILFLGEALTIRFALASVLVLGGVALSVYPASRS